MLCYSCSLPGGVENIGHDAGKKTEADNTSSYTPSTRAKQLLREILNERDYFYKWLTMED
jgi:hypothetical protein